MWGGGTVAAARRAGRYGLGMLGNANAPGMQEAYEAACREHGHKPGPTMFPSRDTASVVFVADDVDRAWKELGEHLLHDVRTYAAWNPGDETTAGFTHVNTVDELRAAPRSHVIHLCARSDFAGPCGPGAQPVAAVRRVCRQTSRGRISSASVKSCCPRPRRGDRCGRVTSLGLVRYARVQLFRRPRGHLTAQLRHEVGCEDRAVDHVSDDDDGHDGQQPTSRSRLFDLLSAHISMTFRPSDRCVRADR